MRVKPRLNSRTTISIIVAIAHFFASCLVFLIVFAASMTTTGESPGTAIIGCMYILMFPLGYLMMVFPDFMTQVTLLFLNSFCWFWLSYFVIMIIERIGSD